MKRVFVTLLMLSTAILAGCQRDLQGTSYTRGEVLRAQIVRTGTVAGVKYVKIEGTKSPVGTIAGGAVGGIAGSSIGGGLGSDIATVLGAVAGGIVGSKVEEQATASQGIQLLINVDGGGQIAVVQQAQRDLHFWTGQRVKLLSQDGITRVQPYHE